MIMIETVTWLQVTNTNIYIAMDNSCMLHTNGDNSYKFFLIWLRYDWESWLVWFMETSA